MHTPLRSSLLPLLSALFLLCAMPAQARVPKGDLYLGYSRLGENAFYPNTEGLNGLEGAAHLKVGRFLGVEGDVSHYGYGASDSAPHTTTYLFGPRVTLSALHFHVFAHALLGGESSSSADISEDAFAYALGGGVEIPLLPFFAWRVNGDYIDAPSLSTQNPTKARASTGLVFRF